MRKMNDRQLERKLRSVGLEVFVTYFRAFCDQSRPNSDVAQVLFEERDYTWKSCCSRTSHARSIIKVGRERDALTMVSSSTSPLVSDSIKAKASELARAYE